jgi:amino acid adenylation domain-containing protein
MAQSGEIQGSTSFQRILQWNREVPRAVDKLVHCLIQARAAQHPESQAVCSRDGNLTYAELDALSSHLASYLAISRGVGPEVIVPLCFEKSVWTIVGLLAVLKAGGAFLLLDVLQPVARLESIVRQTGATFALSSAASFDTCKILVDQAFVVDASTFLKLESSSSLSPCSSAKLDNAAYIVFTSGSTGTPKGIIIEHSQLSSTSIYCGERMGNGNRSRVFQFASYAFDACITDIIATLVHGGTVCIPSEWERNNAIVDAMRRMEVTSAKFTPSLASNLVIENVPTLTTLVLGGEIIPPSLIEEWAPKLRLILVYGPAECSVICFTSDASQHKPAPGEIGRPVGARGWIVRQENYNELVDIGETGELLIEGPLLGREYLNDQAKTDSHFIHNPAWMMPVLSGSQKQCRLYRTGDLARYLEDGTVCYVGRIDNQVKIRGQRLELEEVERSLHDCLVELGCVGSMQVVVEAVTLAGVTSKQLVAFLSIPESIGFLDWDTEDDGPVLLTSTTERERFSEMVSKIEAMMKLVLPAYAIPSIWIPLRHLPLTGSRKADRRRLRSIVAPLSAKQLAIFTHPSASHSSPRKTHVAVTENESKFQTLWAVSLEFVLRPLNRTTISSPWEVIQSRR